MDEYKEWLLPDEEDSTKAKCRLCQRSFTLSNMGTRALKSHAQGKKHQSMLLHVAKGTATLKDYLKKPEETEASTLKSQPSKPQEGTHWSETVSMSKFTLTQGQHKAEILWALKSVMSHFSYNSSQDIGDVFRAMYPDSKIAQQWFCGAVKLSYLITFGIAPYFKELLLAELTEVPCFVLSFDDCFNPELWQEQMDFVVRYFAQGMVKTRYLTSSFLGHTRAEDLKAKFEEAVSDLNVKKLAQVSMDGPHVNWKLLDMLEQDQSSQDQYPDFLNVGSCSLHVVHGAFHSDMLKTSWGIDSVLKALHNLFSKSPAKREDFIKLTGTETFPLPFCGHRWLENKQVAERALETWPHITTYIRETLKIHRAKFQHPTLSRQ